MSPAPNSGSGKQTAKVLLLIALAILTFPITLAVTLFANDGARR